MIVDAYQHILRNCEIQAKKPAKSVKLQSENDGSKWFLQYGPALSGLWANKAAQ